jgi:hypothetical protein
VISRLINLIWTSPLRREIWLFLLTAMAAVVVGFVIVPPRMAEWWIVHTGYYYILALFVGFTFFAWRVIGPFWTFEWLSRTETRWAVIGISLATAFAVWTDSFGHKILFDEYVLQATAWHMHATKEIGTPLRAYDIAGTWLTVDTFLDKRPYFFTFIISLLHDLTGYRTANAFIVNVAFAFTILALVFWLVREFTGRVAPAFVAVALLATLPVFGQNATGAGMELHNLTMIGVLMVVGVLYIQAPDANRLSLVVFTTALLAQSRYESVIFVVPAAGIVLLGWLRANQVIIPWAAIIAPILFVPYAWHARFVAAKPMLWQLREGDVSRFGWQHVAGNLEGARKFFFSLSPAQPNSFWLTLLGLASVGWVVARAWQWRRTPDVADPQRSYVFVVVAWCSTGIAANLVILMFYYWSRLDEPVAARFALPLYFLFAIGAGGLVHALDVRRWFGTRVAVIGLVVWILVFAVPAYARRLYSTQNLVAHELDWELERVNALRSDSSMLLITNKALVPFLLARIPSITISNAQRRAPEIAWHMQQGTFHEVLVTQVLRPMSANGDRIVDPDDTLPKGFQLEPLELKRFGTRWIRISRLKRIDTEEVTGDQSVGSVDTK